MGESWRNVDRLIEAGTIGLLLFAPLPFGSVFPWTQAVIEGVVALLVALCVARILSSGELRIRRTPLLWPGIAMAAVLATQLLLPVGGSINPHATWSSLRLYLAYLGLACVLTFHFVTKARIVRLLSILIGWGVFLAVLGLANQMLGRAMILWFPKHAYLDRLTSTFVNPNHQALYFSVLFFLTLGLLLRPQRRSRARSGSPGARRRWELGSLPGMMLLVGAMALIGGALVLTMSRGGLFGALVGLLVVFALGLHGRVGNWTLLALAGVLAVVILYASWFGFEPVVERFSALTKEPFGDLRWAVWEGTLRVAGEAPLLGIGLGAFQDAFTLYRPQVVPLGKVVDYAHNDYLQLLAEVGVVGFLVMAWAFIGLLIFVLRRWAARHDPFVRGFTMGGLGALAAVAASSATDFGLHMPANALLLVVLGSLLPVVVALRPHPTGDRVDLREWSWDVTPRVKIVGAVSVVVGLLFVGLVIAPPAVADWYFQRAQIAAGQIARSEGGVTIGDLARSHRELEWAARLDPWNPAVQNVLAGVAEELASRAWNFGVGPDGQRLPASHDERFRAGQRFFADAYQAYQQSIRLNPRAGQIHDRLGWLLGSLESVRQTVRGSSNSPSALDARLLPLLASEENLYPHALAHLREGVSWDPQNAYRHQSLALFALSHLRKDAIGREIAAEGFRRALSLEPALLWDVLEHLSSAGADQALLEASVPKRYDLWLNLARYLDRQGRRGTASAAFEEALTLASDPMAQAEVRLAYTGALLRGGNVPGAIAQARHALVLAPKNPEVFATLSTVYEAMGKYDDAEIALSSAVTLAGGGDPRQANDYRGRLASYASRRGQGERALLLRREILQGSPNDPWAHLEVARLLEQRREWNRAFQAYRAAEGLGPQDWSLQRNIARAYARNALLREAITAYEAAVRLRPTEGDLRMEVAEL
ncbi:MAG: O-antigen ligase family protein, partial [Candidatus Rokubacteria bacterium]|nr:O-antigen ligase family protein [Candidatus Rokubacteria bacterium]